MATTAQEVESIVVRLTGDGKQYQQMMTQAKQQTSDFGLTTRLVNNDVDGFGRTLSRFGEAAVAGFGLNALQNFLEGTIGAWHESEEAAIKLDAILVANGRNVAVVTENYRQFAGVLQEITMLEDDSTLSLLAMAESYGITGETALRATRDAAGFAAMNGGNAMSYLRFTAAMAKGDTEMMLRFARMIPQLRGIRDETLLVEKATKLAAVGFETALKEADTFTGRLAQLNNAWGDLKENIGETVSESFKPLLEVLKKGVDYLASFTDEEKRFVTQTMLVLATITSLGPAVALTSATIVPLLRMMADGFQIVYGAISLIFKPLTVLAGIWTGLGAVVSAAFTPIGLLIGAAALAIGVFVARMGGIENALDAVRTWAAETWTAVSEWGIEAWETIKEYASAFWEWFQPIWRAFGSLMRTVWELAVQAARVAWGYIQTAAIATWQLLKQVWQSMFGDAEVNWEQIRDTVRDALYFIEFALLNLEQVAEYAWAGIKLGAVVFANFLLNNIFLTLLGPGGTIIVLLRSLNINWTRVFTAIALFTVRAINQITQAAVTMGRNVLRALRGLPAIIDQGVAALSGIEVTFAGINVPSLNRLEQELRDEFNRLGGRLGEDFAAFLARRLAEESASTRRTRERERLGETMGEDIERGMGRPLARIDGALFGSLEAVSRILEYQQRILQPTPRPTPRLGGESATDVLPTLRQIAENTRRTAARPDIRVEPAGL